MRKRVELNGTLEPVVLRPSLLHELHQHARHSYPEECCGLITGTSDDLYRTVYRCHNDMTLRHHDDPVQFPRDAHRAYYMREVDCLRAQQDAEARGEHVTAVYHSHADADAYFSEMDQEFADGVLFPFPEAAQIVLAVWEQKVSRVGLFERDPNGGYVGRSVEASAP